MSTVSQESKSADRTIVIKDNKIDSEVLLSGAKELVITHNSESYRLRLTANQKLILIK